MEEQWRSNVGEMEQQWSSNGGEERRRGGEEARRRGGRRRGGEEARGRGGEGEGGGGMKRGRTEEGGGGGFGPLWAEHGQFCPILVMFDMFDHILGDFCQLWAELGQILAEFDRRRPNLGRAPPSLGDLDQPWPHSANFGPTSAKFGRPKLADYGPLFHLGRTKAKIAWTHASFRKDS